MYVTEGSWRPEVNPLHMPTHTRLHSTFCTICTHELLKMPTDQRSTSGIVSAALIILEGCPICL